MARKPTATFRAINRRLLRMSNRVCQAVDRSIRCLIDQDERMAVEVIAGDDAIDFAEVRVEEECVAHLTSGQPFGPDEVRYLLCVIKINVDLERIADCAVNVAERLAAFVRREAPALPPDLRILANSSYAMLRDAMKAWARQDAALAGEILRADDIVDALYDQLARDLDSRVARSALKGTHYLDYLMVARNYERIADHSTNIAESVIHSVTGRIIRHQGKFQPQK